MDNPQFQLARSSSNSSISEDAPGVSHRAQEDGCNDLAGSNVYGLADDGLFDASPERQRGQLLSQLAKLRIGFDDILLANVNADRPSGSPSLPQAFHMPDSGSTSGCAVALTPLKPTLDAAASARSLQRPNESAMQDRFHSPWAGWTQHMEAHPEPSSDSPQHNDGLSSSPLCVTSSSKKPFIRKTYASVVQIDSSSVCPFSLTEFPPNIIVKIINCLDRPDKRQIRLTSKDLCYWVGQVVSSLKMEQDKCSEIQTFSLGTCFPNLRALQFRNCYNLQATSFQQFFARNTIYLGHLVKLELQWCSGVTAQALLVLPLVCPNLQWFKVMAVGLATVPPPMPASYHASQTSSDVTIASAITALTKLKDLHLEDIHGITDSGLAALSTLTRLTLLALIFCPEVSDAGFAHVSAFTNLEQLDLGSNRMSGSFIYSLTTLTKLQKLSLRGCQGLQQDTWLGLAELTTLRHLDLGGVRHLQNSHLPLFSSLTGLEVLDLQRTRMWVRDEGMFTLSQLPRLSKLVLPKMCVTKGYGDGFPVLKKLLITDEWTGTNWKKLFPLPNLVNLQMKHIKPRADDELIEGISQQHSLLSLIVCHCRHISDAGFTRLSQLTRLTSLHLYGCRSIQDSGIVALQSLTSLKTLGLGNFVSVSDRGLKLLAAAKLPVEKLWLWCFPGVTDHGVGALAKSWSCLVEVTLHKCSLVTDEAVRSLAVQRKVVKIVVDHCEQTTLEGCNMLADSLAKPRLEVHWKP